MSRRWVGLALGPVLAWASTAAPLEPPPPVEVPERVLMVVIDALRPDHLGANGYPRGTSPSFDRLAAAGVLFEEGRSTSTWTKPALASLFSGVGPMTHALEKGGVREASAVPALAPEYETLAELFQRHDFATVAFTGNPHLSDGTRLTQGFDQVTQCAPFRTGLVDDFLSWLDVSVIARPELVQRLSRHRGNLLPPLEEVAERLPEPLRGSTSARGLEVSPAEGTGRRRCLSVPLAAVPQEGGPFLFGITLKADTGVEARVRGLEGWARNLLAAPQGPGDDVVSLQPGAPPGDRLSLELCFPPGGGSAVLAGMFLVPSAVAREQGSARWFAYLHLLNPHLPYLSSPSHSERFAVDDYGEEAIPIPAEALEWVGGQRISGTEDLRVYLARYDAAIHEADEGLGRIVERLAALHLLEDTLVVVTSDHGQQFLEHGLLSHAGSPYEELLRVPILFHYPKGILSGARIPGSVSLVDIYPTIAELLGFEPGGRLEGQSLRPVLVGEREQVLARVFVTTHTSQIPSDEVRADVVIEGGYKLLVTRYPGGESAAELYDLREDPGEKVNLADQRPGVVRVLLGLLGGERRRAVERRPPATSTPPMVQPDSGTIGLLKSLGYVVD